MTQNHDNASRILQSQLQRYLMNSRPSVKTTQQALRFDDLLAADFERLCLGLLQSESGEWQQAQHYG